MLTSVSPVRSSGPLGMSGWPRRPMEQRVGGRGTENSHFLTGTVSLQKPISSWAPLPMPSFGRKGHLGCHWLTDEAWEGPCTSSDVSAGSVSVSC